MVDLSRRRSYAVLWNGAGWLKFPSAYVVDPVEDGLNGNEHLNGQSD